VRWGRGRIGAIEDQGGGPELVFAEKVVRLSSDSRREGVPIPWRGRRGLPNHSSKGARKPRSWEKARNSPLHGGGMSSSGRRRGSWGGIVEEEWKRKEWRCTGERGSFQVLPCLGNPLDHNYPLKGILPLPTRGREGKRCVLHRPISRGKKKSSTRIVFGTGWGKGEVRGL